MATNAAPVKAKLPFTDKLIRDSTLKFSNANFEEDIKVAVKNKRPWTSKIEELRNVAEFPSTYEFAILAKKAYDDKVDESESSGPKKKKRKTTKLPDGWKILTAAVDNSWFSIVNGYVGTAFWKPDQRQIVIAHRGTVPTNIGADYTDIKGIYANNYVGQMNSACTFAHKVYAAIKSVDDVAKWQIFFTGHSLGAWLAQITTFSLKYLTLGKKVFSKSSVIGFHAHTEVFDSPGCQEMLTRMAKDFDVRYHGKVVEINNLDITSYLSSPNMINCCNFHVGALFRIYPEIARDKPGLYTQASHRMDGILAFFEQTINESNDIKMKRVIDWPKLDVTFSFLQLCSPFAEPLLGEEYDDFFNWAKKLNDFDPKSENVTFDKYTIRRENPDPNIYTPIRYQVTEAMREISYCETVFTESELETLRAFNWLRKVKEFFKPESFFEDLTQEDKKSIVNRLCLLELQDKSVICSKGNILRGMIPFAKTLIRIFPELDTKTKNALSSSGARKQIYLNTSNKYKSKLESTVSMFRSPECPSLLSFVRGTDVKMAHIQTEYCTGLVMARAIKCLESFRDSFENYFAMELQILIAMDISFNFGEILKSKELGRTLVLLECKDSHLESQTETLTNLIHILTEIDSVKILLVTRDGPGQSQIEMYSGIKLRNQYLKIPCDDFKLDDLNELSRAQLLSNKVVTFQGQKEKVSLSEIIGDDSSEVGQLFDSLTLTKLIKNETIAIGSELEGLNEIETYYIPRKFKYNERISQNIFSGLRKNDQSSRNNSIKLGNNEILLLSGITEDELISEFRLSPEKLCQLRDFNSSKKCNIVIIETYENFLNLCVENPKFCFHWIRYQDDSLYWNASRGKTEIIREALNGFNTSSHNESDLLNELSEGKIVMISEAAGMGKSTVLTSLALKHKKLFPHLWILRINLNSCTSMLVKLLAERKTTYFTKENSDSAVKFLLDKILVNNDGTKLNQFEKKVFERVLTRNVRVVLFVDAFDEISPDYDQIVTQFLVSLSYSRVRNILITTRPHSSPQLEENLGTLPIRMLPLNVEDQINFLIRFWDTSKTFSGQEFIIQGDKIQFALDCIEILNNSIKSSDGDVMGIPLQCGLLAEYIKVNFDKMEEIINAGISLIKLYVSFVERKLEIYHRDKGRDPEGNLSTKTGKHFVELRLRSFHQMLALQLVMGKRETLMTDEEIGVLQPEVLRVGIVVRLGESPLFIHRTFAEYFVVDYLLTGKDSVNSSALINEILLKNEYPVLRTFLDSLLKSGQRAEESLAIFQNYVNVVVSEYIGNETSFANDRGETALMVALKEKHNFVLEKLIDLLSKKRGSNAMISYIHSNGLMKTRALHYACFYGNEICLKFLVENPPDDWRNILDDDFVTHLELLDEKCHQIFSLIRNGALINVTGKAHLHYAVQMGWNEVCKFLIETGSEIEATDEYNRTPLHVAASNGRAEIVNILVDNGARIDATDKNYRTPLHLAASNNRAEIVKLLVAKGAIIDATDRDNWTPLHLAASKGWGEEIVQILVDKGARIDPTDLNNRTPLHLAASNGRAEVVKILADKGAIINATDTGNRTPLHLAVSNCWAEEIVKILVDNGAKIDAKNSYRETPLDLAFDMYSNKTALFLIENGALLNKDKLTYVLKAVEKGWNEVVDRLTEKDALPF